MTQVFLLISNIERLPLEQAIESAKLRFMERLRLPASHVTLPTGDYPERIAGLRVKINPKLKPGFFKVSTAYRAGDKICMTCGKITEHFEDMAGVSHGYCVPCGNAALAEFEAELAAEKAEFAKAVKEAVI